MVAWKVPYKYNCGEVWLSGQDARLELQRSGCSNTVYLTGLLSCYCLNAFSALLFNGVPFIYSSGSIVTPDNILKAGNVLLKFKLKNKWYHSISDNTCTVFWQKFRPPKPRFQPFPQVRYRCAFIWNWGGSKQFPALLFYGSLRPLFIPWCDSHGVKNCPTISEHIVTIFGTQ